MKIVYDNIIFSLQRAGGASVYWSELIKRIQNQNFISFYEMPNNNIFRLCLKYNYILESILPIRLIQYLPFTKKIEQKAIFHSSHYRVSLQKNVTNITTVYDFTYEYYIKGLPAIIHSLRKNFAVRNSDGIICISENTKKDLLKFLPDIDESKIKVIYISAGDEFYPIDDRKSFLVKEFPSIQNNKFILFVGDRSAYKNFSVVIKTIEKLEDYCLVVVGGKDFSVDEIELMRNIQNRLYHFKGLNSNQLNILYNNSFCLLYPSSYEGFGIPIVEAMRAGCPVISTNYSSIPEVAGDAGILVNNITADSFLFEIKKLENESYRNSKITLGLEQAKKFSWDKCFNETFAFYEEIWKKKDVLDI